ncbi:VOC family protein [Adhaeretor mobilis]|uniref:VOC family protein n=1 Tax=Adhaeretor mobilis TaxID=1930276 RepID=UPI001C54CC92|nr:VOC family protein [Adhaeretor mobilis]
MATSRLGFLLDGIWSRFQVAVAVQETGRGVARRLEELKQRYSKLNSGTFKRTAHTEKQMKIAMTSVFVDDPVEAHEFYTKTLGFRSVDFQPDAQLAVVVSAEDPKGTTLLLEPRGDSFAKTYQEKVYGAGLPIIVFSAADLEKTRKELESRGVKFRDDLAKPEWGLENLFEDTFGNLIMLQGEETSETSEQ